MTTPTISSSPGRPAPLAGSGARQLAVALVAYVSAVSASVGAVAAVVGSGLPLDLLIAVA